MRGILNILGPRPWNCRQEVMIFVFFYVCKLEFSVNTKVLYFILSNCIIIVISNDGVPYLLHEFR